MIKKIHHVCIQTNRYEDSLRFYLDILEFQIIKETPDFHGRQYNTWISLGDFMVELQTPKHGEEFNSFDKENEGIAHICFYVEDIEKEYDRIVSLGWSDFAMKNGSKVYSVEGGKLFKVIAPEGTIIEVRDNEVI